MKKKILALLTLFIFCATTANASILGSLLVNSGKINIGNGLNLYNNTFLSDQKGVGNQTEYYAEYKPNDAVVPVVVTGEAIYGKRNSKEIMEYMQNNNLKPMLGINASFFSLSTGIPMGHVITDGVVTSKDNRSLPGVGFRADGTGFIEDLCIETSISFGEDYTLQIPHINKYISKDTQMLTLFTDDFGKKTGTDTKTINVILDNVTDKVRIGESFRATVSQILTSDTPIEISEGKMVLSVNLNGNQWAILLINAMQLGEEITFKTTATVNSWNEATQGLASEGARLLTNGVVNPKLEAGSAPRTAVGIKADNTVVFYVLDGRQTGYSYGSKQKTLAERLKELGCVDAINLDGGGSTTMSGVYPGCDENAIINSPSEGSLRKVTNFIFLKNTKAPTGNIERAYIYPYSGKILSGSTISLETKAVDDNYYPVSYGNVDYSVNEFGKITKDGKLTALGEGDIIVKNIADGKEGEARFKSILTPDEIKIYNRDNNKELTDIDAAAGDTFRLYAKAFHKGIELMSSADAYNWSISSNDASVTQNGVLTISPSADKSFTLTVKAGTLSKNYKVKIPENFYNYDLYPSTLIDIQNNILKITMSSKAQVIDLEKSYFKIDGEKYSLSDAEVNMTDEKNISVSYKLSGDEHKIFALTVQADGLCDVVIQKTGTIKENNIFTDTTGHWAKDIISYMNSKGVVNGSDEDGKSVYKPENRVTRAEFAIMVSNFMGFMPENYDDVSLEAFTDKEDIPSWALPQIKAVYKEKIITGKDNNGKLYFEPNSYITRAEAATIISRILPDGMKKQALSYNDSNDIPEWSKDAFKVLTMAKLINGYDDNTIKAKNNVTRAEAVTMLYNIY